MQSWCRISLVLTILLATLLTQSHSSLIDPVIKIVSPTFVMSVFEMIYNVLDNQADDPRPSSLKANQFKLQSRIPETVPFPCDVSHARSPERPTSVHALRPGDIDVVGAMGDSLSAAFGAKATDVLHVAVANRGVAFPAGGEGTWRSFLTLANILKEFNSNLVGFSTGDALSWQPRAELNVAEGFATVEDMPHQAMLLIQRMKNDTRINFDEDWKVITLLIGFNDICTDMCRTIRFENLDKFYENQQVYLIKALDILYETMPRVLVNLVSVTNVIRLFDQYTAKSLLCDQVYQAVECSCIGLNKFPSANNKQAQRKMLDALSLLGEDIAGMDRYKKRNDFAVVAQTFSRGLRFPTKFSSKFRRNVTDYSYLSPDCFHFSQKGHSLTANALWNNMLEPVGQKSRDWTYPIMSRFMCPTEKHPFIYTAVNTP